MHVATVGEEEHDDVCEKKTQTLNRIFSDQMAYDAITSLRYDVVECMITHGYMDHHAPQAPFVALATADTRMILLVLEVYDLDLRAPHRPKPDRVRMMRVYLDAVLHLQKRPDVRSIPQIDMREWRHGGIRLFRADGLLQQHIACVAARLLEGISTEEASRFDSNLAYVVMEIGSLAAVHEFMESGIFSGDVVFIALVLVDTEDMTNLIMELLHPMHAFYVGSTMHDRIIRKHARKISAVCGRSVLDHYVQLLHDTRSKEACIYDERNT